MNCARKLVSLSLVMVLILAMVPTALASDGQTGKTATTAIPQLRNARLLETCDASPNGVFRTYVDGAGRMINARETSTGFVEFAYNENGVVHTYEYQDGNMISHAVSPSDDFEEELEQILPLDESKLEEVLSRKIYESVAELQAALQQAGISAYVYMDTDGDLVVDPLIVDGQPKVSTPTHKRISIMGLKSKFPALSLKPVGSKSFKAKPNDISKVMSCNDTRTQYAITKNSTNTLKAGIKVVTAAAKVCLTPASLRSLFGLGSSIITLAQKLKLTRSIKATAICLRHATIVDYTNPGNRRVSIVTYKGKDRFAVGKATESSPYGWFCEYVSVFDDYPISGVLDTGIAIWNRNMIEYGRWKWGDL